jgi:hypothetical protein
MMAREAGRVDAIKNLDRTPLIRFPFLDDLIGNRKRLYLRLDGHMFQETKGLTRKSQLEA